MPKSSPPIYLVEALAREAYDSLPEEKAIRYLPNATDIYWAP